MIFIFHSGPYWTPKIADRLTDLILEFGGDSEALQRLRFAIETDEDAHKLAIQAHQAFLDADPDIRRSRDDEDYAFFERRLIEILIETRRPTNAFLTSRNAVAC